MSETASSLSDVPEDDSKPTHVLSKGAVRWAIDTLGAQRLHPTFVMYLYLRREYRAGRLESASASSDELLSLIRMPGSPTKPYYFPLIDRGERTGKPLPTFWRSPNISGSWSPGSIFRLKGGGWMGLEAGGYAFPEDHVERAFKDLLYETPVSAHALGAFFLRNDGFRLSGEPVALDVVRGFRAKFDYPADTNDEFARLFTASSPADFDIAWFDTYSEPTHLEPSAAEDSTSV